MSATAPTAKRARSGVGSSDQALTAAECDKLVQRLSKETAQALLANLVASSPEVRAAVEAEVGRRDAKPVDLSAYSLEASEIVHSLDGLRDSQQYERCGTVRDGLSRLVVECKENLSSPNAFAALVEIMDVVRCETDGEVRKGVLCGYGSIDGHIADELEELARDLSSEQKASISGAIEKLGCVVEALRPECFGDELREVLELVR